MVLVYACNVRRMLKVPHSVLRARKQNSVNMHVVGRVSMVSTHMHRYYIVYR